MGVGSNHRKGSNLLPQRHQGGPELQGNTKLQIANPKKTPNFNPGIDANLGELLAVADQRGRGVKSGAQRNGIGLESFKKCKKLQKSEIGKQ